MLDNEFSPSRAPDRGRRLRLGILLSAGALILFVLWLKFETLRPSISLARPAPFLGRETMLFVEATDRGSGLSLVEVSVLSEDGEHEIFRQEYPATKWRGSDVHQRSIPVPVNAREAKIPDGEATLRLRARDHSWLNYVLTRWTTLEVPVQIDTIPPSVEVLTGTHYMRRGGSDLVIYKTSADATRSDVIVGKYAFAGVAGALRDPAVSVAFFAVPHDVEGDVRPALVVEDRAGNTRSVALYAKIRDRKFRDRRLDLPESFLREKIPELMFANDREPTDDIVANYLVVNRELRATSEQMIREICESSEPSFLWTEPFLRQPGAAPLSHFADRRTYVFQEEIVDHQTHLGFDLASLRRSEVPAANHGIVRHADDLGIYGTTVILDHGLGVSTLYGHLSSVDVKPGQRVARGDVVGRTGETGLAAGDHLHFSVALRGTHVDPREWWDPKWVRDHVTDKIADLGGIAEAKED